MDDEAEFDAFVVARSGALLRTAYLLVHDEKLAEDLLQSSLAKAWFAWRRIDGEAGAVRQTDPGDHVGLLVASTLVPGDPDIEPPEGRTIDSFGQPSRPTGPLGGTRPPPAPPAGRGGASVPRGPVGGERQRTCSLLGRHGQEPVLEGPGRSRGSTRRWSRSTRGAQAMSTEGPAGTGRPGRERRGSSSTERLAEVHELGDRVVQAPAPARRGGGHR